MAGMAEPVSTISWRETAPKKLKAVAVHVPAWAAEMPVNESVALVAPAIGLPLRDHWIAGVGLPARESESVTLAASPTSQLEDWA